MQILIFSGFLGSGKTTAVQKVIRAITARGETVAIIENEIGKTGIDQNLLAETGIQVTPLFGGCVCCQISGDLLLATRRIQEEIAPDWLIVELTGLAALSSIRDLFKRYGDPAVLIQAVALADAARWDALFKISPVLLEQQLTGVSAVLVTKTDVKAPSEALLAQVGQLAPQAAVLPMDLRQADCDDLWRKLLETMR